MHLAGATDDPYLSGLMVAIASVHFHDPAARFSVLTVNLSPEGVRRLDRLGRYLGCRIDRIAVDAQRLAGIELRSAYLSLTALARLMLPTLLPDEARVIYFDSDLVFLASLAPVWAVDLGDYLLAAACDREDLRGLSAEMVETMNREFAATGSGVGRYVNSGLMLLNLDLWRAENIGAACLAFLERQPRTCVWHDQSAINACCGDRTLHLDRGWNVLTSGVDERGADFVSGIRPRVLHFIGPNKPWARTVVLDELWLAHARRISPLLPSQTVQRRADLTTLRRRWMGLLLGKAKYRKRHAAARALHGSLQADYLARLQASGAVLRRKWREGSDAAA